MTQVVSRGGTGCIPCQTKWGVWWTKWPWDRYCTEYFCFPVNIIPTMLHTHLQLLRAYCSYQDKRTKPGDLHKVMLFRISRNTGHNIPLFFRLQRVKRNSKISQLRSGGACQTNTVAWVNEWSLYCYVSAKCRLRGKDMLVAQSL